MQENGHAKHNVILECKLKKGKVFFYLFLEEKWKNKEQQEP